MHHTSRPWLWLAALACLLVAAILLSLLLGPVSVSPAELLGTLTGDAEDGKLATIVWDLRLRRALLAALIGAGLGASGAGYQGLFRNPLADPFLIGASSGAALGAAVAIIAGWNVGAWGAGAVPLAAFVGAVLAVAAVYQLATIGSDTPMVSMILAGAVLSSFLSAIVALLMLWNQQHLIAIFSWLLGSTTGRSWAVVAWVAPLVAIGSITLWSQSRRLDALMFGEETAGSLGARVPALRRVVILAASVATAAAVAGGGIIGFVGLVAPHLARSLVGARHALLIPASALTGGLLLLLADDLARTAVAPGELPLGVVTALVGAPCFFVLLKRRQRWLGVFS